jgi:cation-transporting ATPase E
VAELFVTKSVFTAVVGLAIALPTATYPLLPRQFTIASTVTIGIPAFVLALAPNSRRARPHFVSRVARFAIPTGLVAAAATYLTYLAARDQSGTSLREARTTCTLALFAIALWVLAIVARTSKERSAWLIPTMASGLAVVLAVPRFRDFFALSVPGPLLLLAAVGAVALAGLAMESGWRLAGWAQTRMRELSRRSQ